MKSSKDPKIDARAAILSSLIVPAMTNLDDLRPLLPVNWQPTAS